MLTVWDIEGREHAVDSREELVAILQRRNSRDCNWCHITLANRSQPALAVTLRGQEAYLYFCPNDHDAGAFALSSRPRSDPDALATFWISDSETIEVPNRAVVTAAEAVAAADAFRLAPERPQMLEWFEL